MRTIVAALLAVFLAQRPLVSGELGFRLMVSGKLAEKLEADTTLSLWCPCNAPSAWISVGLTELPVDLPFERFHKQTWHVAFYSKKSGPYFSVTLNHDLFDRARTVNILLDSPEPRLHADFGWSGGLFLFYSPNITKRMFYRDLPRWDATKGRIVQSPAPVVLVTRLRDGVTVYSGEMGDSCRASRWFIQPGALASKLEDGEAYRASVRYDSGGLFPPTNTTCDFTYRASYRDPSEGGSGGEEEQN
ncbi:MAG: hypothetical protein NTY19_04675 [Planctomycetota bacterium]|nr:hypothetical protein [Planctomycetota bacterium]